MIPKIVHYCWFGRGKKSSLIKKCIDSWHKYLPDWEFMEWNEDNYDFSKSKYAYDAYSQRKWAFVADYARFDVLNQYGGVYFDTDVELLKPIPCEILEQEAFTGFQSNNRVAPGLVFGAEKGQPGLKKMLNVYQNWKFEIIEGVKPPNILDAFNEAFLPDGLTLNGKFQIVDGIAIYPNAFFCCYDFETLTMEIKPETVSVHYFAASWMPKKQKIKQMFIRSAVKILGPKRYKQMKRLLLGERNVR